MRFNEINDPVRTRAISLATELMETYPVRMRQSDDASKFYLEVWGCSNPKDLLQFTTRHKLRIVSVWSAKEIIILSSEL